MTSQSYCHTLVTSDDIVISHEVIEKGVEDSEKMISYNIYYTC